MMTRFDKATPFSYSRPMKMFRFFTLIVLCLLFPASLTVLAQTNGLELLQFKERNGIVVEGDVGEVSLLPYAMNFLDAQSVSLDFSFLQSDAGFSSAFGIAFLDGNNEPVGGEVVRANVKDFGDVSRIISQNEWSALGAMKLTTFVLADSARKNGWVKDGDAVSFLKEADNTYEVFVGGTQLNHADQGALFGDFTLNPGGFPNMTDLPSANGYYEGSMDWEDRHALSERSDFDFNDISLDMDVVVEDAQGNLIDGTNWAGVLIGSLLRRANDGQSWGEAISDRILISDGSMCWNAENAQGGLVGFANVNRELPPDNVQDDREIMYGIYVNDDLTTGYIIESGGNKRSFDLGGDAEKRFCIYREGTTIFYALNGQTIHTSLWPMPEGDVLFADVLLTIPESYIENLEGWNFVENHLGPDDDRDGMPDDWELANGLNPSNALDAVQDPDGDGLQNFMEYADGSDPYELNYVDAPTGYLWWMKGSFLDEGNGWVDLSERGHDALDVTAIYKVEEDDRQYAWLDLGDEITVGEGVGDWIPDPATNAMESVGFTMMVALKPLWSGAGYENLIDLSSGTSSNGGFRLGIQDGAWVVDSPSNEGVCLDDNAHHVKSGENTVIIVRYSDNGLLEIWERGKRRTWTSKSLIKNITGRGKIHALSQGSARFQSGDVDINTTFIARLETHVTALLASLIEASLPSTFAQQAGNGSFAMIEEIILFGKTLSYAETLALNTTHTTVSTDTLFDLWANYCEPFTGDPNADPDNDGVTTRDEIILHGTDPFDDTSYLKLDIFNNWDNTITLGWPVSGGRLYRLDGCEILSNWNDEGMLLLASGVDYYTKDRTFPGLYYWRLKTEPYDLSDQDGLPNWLERCIGTSQSTDDTDGDGVSDVEEINNGLPAPGVDSDGDDVEDWKEILIYGTMPNEPGDDTDSDDDGLLDSNEDINGNGVVDAGETDPNNPDTDADGLQDGLEKGLTSPQGSDTDLAIFMPDSDPSTTTDPLDDDSDDDGLLDGTEDMNTNGMVDVESAGASVAAMTMSTSTGLLETDPNKADTDGDGIQDGTEQGLLFPQGSNTVYAVFIPDADPTTTTNPLDVDTDGDGQTDGQEDPNGNGQADEGETDPSEPEKIDTDGDGLPDEEDAVPNDSLICFERTDATLYEYTQLSNVPTDSGIARKLNNNNDVLFSIGVWQEGGSWTYLDIEEVDATTGIFVSYANDFNDAGQIVGVGHAEFYAALEERNPKVIYWSSKSATPVLIGRSDADFLDKQENGVAISPTGKILTALERTADGTTPQTGHYLTSDNAATLSRAMPYKGDFTSPYWETFSNFQCDITDDDTSVGWTSLSNLQVYNRGATYNLSAVYSDSSSDKREFYPEIEKLQNGKHLISGYATPSSLNDNTVWIECSPGVFNRSDNYPKAIRINDKGQGLYNETLWRNGHYVNLIDLAPSLGASGYNDVRGIDINDEGVILVRAYTSDWTLEYGLLKPGAVVDLTIGETARPANRIAWNDPMFDHESARNKLLVWHETASDSIKFNLIKDAEVNAVYYRIDERQNWNPTLPLDGLLTANSETKHYTIDQDSGSYDFEVHYGASTAERLDTGPYEIYGISPKDYSDAKNNFDILYIHPLFKLAYTLFYHTRNGTWPDKGYDPTSTSGTATMTAESRTKDDPGVTHNVGATFTVRPDEEIDGRKYPRANVTMPIWYWDRGEDSNELIRESSQFESSVRKFIQDISYIDLNAAYNAVGGGSTRTVVIDITESRPLRIKYGPNIFTDRDIGLGDVDIVPKSGEQYRGGGSITLSVTKSGSDYIIAANPSVDLTIDDVWDFNYFNVYKGLFQNLPKGPRDAATLQCGYGQPEADPGVGQVGLVRIDVVGPVDVPQIVKTP